MIVVTDEKFDPFEEDVDTVIRHTPVARVRRPSLREEPDTLRRRREAAESSTKTDRNPLRGEGIEPLDAYAVLEFKRPGIQNGVFRKLKQGRYESEARLDLHRQTVASARREVFEFVTEAVNLGLRSLLIVHGRGSSASPGQSSAVLKGYINHWLPNLVDVQAFCTARPEHGSTGAIYVLLRKSEAKKMENRLQFNKGRTAPPGE
jgi:DNA-nicking Smr family endonuclease